MSAVVTILVPVHNAAAYLGSALESLRAQTFSDWQCVCVDDGSTDATPSILADFATRDSRFIILTQPSRGVAAARNLLLKHISSDWVFFLDADDVLAPNALETLVGLQRTSGAQLVWGQYSRFRDDAELQTASVANIRSAQVRILRDGAWYKLCSENYSLTHALPFDGDVFKDVPCQPWNKLIHRKLLTNRRFDESLTRGEDLVFFADVFAELECVVVTDLVTYFYRDSDHTLFRTGGGYRGFHYYAQAACRFARADALRSRKMSAYLARRWILSWLRAVTCWGRLGEHAEARESFLTDCHQLLEAFGTRMPLLSRLAVRFVAAVYRIGFD